MQSNLDSSDKKTEFELLSTDLKSSSYLARWRYAFAVFFVPLYNVRFSDDHAVFYMFNFFLLFYHTALNTLVTLSSSIFFRSDFLSFWL